METNIAVRRLSALAQEGRLGVFRLLNRAGKQGMAAGDIARAMDVPPNTLSAQLNLLSGAGLINATRNGRMIIYRADFESMSDLLVYLAEDCCQGHADICQPLNDAARRLAHC